MKIKNKILLTTLLFLEAGCGLKNLTLPQSTFTPEDITITYANEQQPNNYCDLSHYRLLSNSDITITYTNLGVQIANKEVSETFKCNHHGLLKEDGNKLFAHSIDNQIYIGCTKHY